MIQRFTGGSDSVREKLNEMVDEVNALSNIRGDAFIHVKYMPGVGLALSFNNNPILSAGSSGGSLGKGQKQGQFFGMVTQNSGGFAYPFAVELV